MGLSIDGESRIGPPMPHQSVHKYRGPVRQSDSPCRRKPLEIGTSIRPLNRLRWTTVDHSKLATLEGRALTPLRARYGASVNPGCPGLTRTLARTLQSGLR